MDKNIILFGCGIIGVEALTFLGNENIRCFCDNDMLLVGKERCGKEIISFEELKKNYKEEIIIICAATKNVYAIAAQCESNGIEDYFFFEPVRKTHSGRDEFLEFIGSPINRIRMRKEIYWAKAKELQGQVDYFKQHTDIRYMKPAQGELREKQLHLVREATVFFDKISDLDIRPILDGGNLLGYVRHNGFIPWDDDIDCALIREEYDKLKEYFQQHIYTLEEFYNKNKMDRRTKCVLGGMEDYCWLDYGDHIQIFRFFMDGRITGMDFFSLDYYAEDYAFQEFIDFAGKVNEKWIASISIEDKRKCIEMARIENERNIAKESSHLYFGIDNMIMRQKSFKGSWIPKEVVFPLKKVKFEGEYFWVPNDPEKFLSYEYDDIWEFPDDVGIPKHIERN